MLLPCRYPRAWLVLALLFSSAAGAEEMGLAESLARAERYSTRRIYPPPFINVRRWKTRPTPPTSCRTRSLSSVLKMSRWAAVTIAASAGRG